MKFPKNSIEYKNYMIVPFYKVDNIFYDSYYAFYEVYKKEKYDNTCLISCWHRSIEEAKKSIDILYKYNLIGKQ